ncbi:hypothetical protein OROGR_021543 [Orobanche gracilis]
MGRIIMGIDMVVGVAGTQVVVVVRGMISIVVNVRALTSVHRAGIARDGGASMMVCQCA